MSNITIKNLEMPTWNTWGMFQLEELPNSYYRFWIDDNEVTLVTNVFVVNPDGDGSAGEQHDISKTSDIYIDIQKALEIYLKNKNPIHTDEFKTDMNILVSKINELESESVRMSLVLGMGKEPDVKEKLEIIKTINEDITKQINDLYQKHKLKL